MADVALFRISKLGECVEIAKRLALAGELAKVKMDKNVAEVTKAKRIELWEKLLTQVGFEDMEVVRYMREGVPLTGWEDERRFVQTTMGSTYNDKRTVGPQCFVATKALMGKAFTDEERGLAKLLMEENYERGICWFSGWSLFGV